MDAKKRRWNTYHEKKSSSVMISLLPTTASSSKDEKSKDDFLSSIKSMPNLFGVKHARVALIFAAIILVMTCLYISFNRRTDNLILNHTVKDCPRLAYRPRDIVNVKPLYFELKPQDWINKECFNGNPPNDVDSLSSSLHLWAQSEEPVCKELYHNLRSIYQMREKIAEITISDTFLVKVKKWLKNDEELIASTRRQTLVFVDNLYTQESVVFNPVRSRRPGASGGDSSQILREIVETSKENCDFCNYKQLTAMDSFGILESKHSVIVSNTFKIEKYHGMILLRQHNPSNFTMEHFLDSMQLASVWYEKVHELVPDHDFRHLYWDVYPKASASQIHPHLHITLGNMDYYAKWNHFHTSALNYAFRNNGNNYWSRIIEAHHSLGLAVEYGEAVALAYLTPQKDYSTFVICRQPSVDFFKLVYFVFKAFIEDLKLYAYSSGFVFPRWGHDSSANGNELPALFSIVYRGSLAGSRSDISSFDLFGTANVNVSPYKVIDAIRASVKKRKDEKSELSEDFKFR